MWISVRVVGVLPPELGFGSGMTWTHCLSQNVPTPAPRAEPCPLVSTRLVPIA